MGARSFLIMYALAVAIAFLVSCNDGGGEAFEVEQPLAGGATTVFDRSSNAFTLPAPNLTESNLDIHLDGDVAFEARFVTAPADVNPGLGPLFNNTSCNGCHIRNGRGMPAAGTGRGGTQLLVRVGMPGAVAGDIETQVGVPGIGGQIRDHAIYGYEPDAVVSIDWVMFEGTYAEGTPYHLRKPVAGLARPGGEPFPPGLLTSLRVPPPVHGLGLLEALEEETILANADSDDRDRDGISGRPNYVWDEAAGEYALGRFGLKANQPNLRQQSAGAYVNDMGVTSPLFPEEDGRSDIDETTLRAAAFYAQTLGVPARVDWADPDVRAGEALFEQIQCAACHVPAMRTGFHELDELSDQTIHAYTDLLLHAMGPGLADGRPDFDATGEEWRTPPLWGLGLTHTVLPGAGLMHDGRARTIEEAILWHGGEAEASREAFRNLPALERERLLAFLRSL